MSTENQNQEAEELQIFRKDNASQLTREFYESLVSVVAAGALGGHNVTQDQIACATWILERTDELLEFKPNSKVQ